MACPIKDAQIVKGYKEECRAQYEYCNYETTCYMKKGHKGNHHAHDPEGQCRYIWDKYGRAIKKPQSL